VGRGGRRKASITLDDVPIEGSCEAKKKMLMFVGVLDRGLVFLSGFSAPTERKTMLKT
jgi:hypothetical protein